MTWWESLEEYLDERDERDERDGAAPDPWDDVDVGHQLLTEDQVAFLRFDQPAVLRLGDLRDALPRSATGQARPPTGEGTGNSPGDA